MTEFATLHRDTRGPVEILSLNRPDQLNALNPQMARELATYFDGLHESTDIRVVVLRGEGRAFCAGADLNSSAIVPPGDARPHEQLAMQRLYSGVVRSMRSCPQPIIALIQGPACGGGFSLVLAADVRIAASDARMNAAYLRVGLGGCDMGSGYLLPRLVGLSIASELLLTGRFIDAERAKSCGLVSDVVPQEQLLEAGLALANDMLRASPLGLRLTKETLDALLAVPGFDAALKLEDRQQVILTETADHREAVSAFMERRPPSYGNR
jgi:enoyl-CoA hydratase/carnithine racemase